MGVLFTVLGVSNLNAQKTNEHTFRVVAESASSSELMAYSNVVRSVVPMNIQLPTAFSPNGDGLNDSFGILAEGLEEMELIIYNRWGKIVYQSKRIGEKWDGTINGVVAPTGVYGYELAAKNANRESIVKKGSVTLVH